MDSGSRNLQIQWVLNFTIPNSVTLFFSNLVLRFFSNVCNTRVFQSAIVFFGGKSSESQLLPLVSPGGSLAIEASEDDGLREAWIR